MIVESLPQLERVQAGGGRRPPAPLLVGAVLTVAAFLVGLGLGRQVGSGTRPTTAASPGQPASGGPPFTAASVSHELLTAYLNRNPSGDVNLVWGLCRLDGPLTCQPITALPRTEDVLANRVADEDWAAFPPITAPPGHYLLAGPVVGALDAGAVVAGIGPGGYPAYESDARAQAIVGGVLWADLGPVGRGRYVASIWALQRSSDLPDGRFEVRPWYLAIGFAVSDAP